MILATVYSSSQTTNNIGKMQAYSKAVALNLWDSYCAFKNIATNQHFVHFKTKFREALIAKKGLNIANRFVKFDAMRLVI